jgi:hypothetical protein
LGAHVDTFFTLFQINFLKEFEIDDRSGNIEIIYLTQFHHILNHYSSRISYLDWGRPRALTLCCIATVCRLLHGIIAIDGVEIQNPIGRQ